MVIVRFGKPPCAKAACASIKASAAASRRVMGGLSLSRHSANRTAAARPQVAGLLLVTPVSSVTALARHHYAVVPAFLVRDAFRADLALPRYGGRVAFLLAGRDEVAPPDLARALFEAYPGPKRLWEEREASHNTLRFRPGDPLWGEVWKFLML